MSDFLPFFPFDFADVFVSRDGVGETAANLCPYFLSCWIDSASQFFGLPLGPLYEYEALMPSENEQ